MSRRNIMIIGLILIGVMAVGFIVCVGMRYVGAPSGYEHVDTETCDNDERGKGDPDCALEDVFNPPKTSGKAPTKKPAVAPAKTKR